MPKLFFTILKLVSITFFGFYCGHLIDKYIPNYKYLIRDILYLILIFIAILIFYIKEKENA